jgi:hypothetical protein
MLAGEAEAKALFDPEVSSLRGITAINYSTAKNRSKRISNTASVASEAKHQPHRSDVTAKNCSKPASSPRTGTRRGWLCLMPRHFLPF